MSQPPEVTLTVIPRYPDESEEAYADRRARMLAMLRNAVAALPPAAVLPPSARLRPISVLPPAVRVEV